MLFIWKVHVNVGTIKCQQHFVEDWSNIRTSYVTEQVCMTIKIRKAHADKNSRRYRLSGLGNELTGILVG